MKNECKLVQRSAPFVGYNEKSLLPITTDLYSALKIADIEIENSMVYVDGIYIHPMELTGMIPASGSIIEVDVVPSGGDGKTALRTVALIALTIAAAYVAGPAGTAFFGGSKLLAVGAAVTTSVVGSLAINALIPPPSAELVPGLGSNLTQDYAITGSQNNYTPYGPIPKVFGTHRIFPPKASLEYTELVAQSQYLNSLFCIGYGPFDISEIKIGETSISEFGDAEYEIGTVDNPPTLFPSLVNETQLNILLDKGALDSFGDYTLLTTEPNTRKISMDIFWPVLYTSGDGTIYVDVQIDIREQGDVTWIELADYTNLAIDVHTTFVVQPTSGTPYYAFRAYDLLDGSLKMGLYMDLPTIGTYEIRVRRYRNIELYDADRDDTYITALRSFINDNPIKTTDNSIVYIATRLLASDKLNGVIDTFNCKVETHHPVYNGSTWNIEVTRNPAWMYVDLLTGNATPTPIAYDRLNIEEIEEWADINDTENFYFDFVLTKQASIKEIANQICNVGRAVPSIKDGLHTVVVEKQQTIPSQIFTARNSWGFQGSKIFTKRIHAFKTTFINADTGYQVDEVIVYDDGYDESNATIFDKLSLNGVTTSDHAWKLGRYHIAVNRLRPETYEINVDIENIKCTRGDLVFFNYDIVLIGLGSARIKSVTLDPPVGGNVDFELIIDDAKTLESTKTYAFDVRTNTGDVHTILVDTPVVSEVDTYTLTGTTTETIGNALAIGNLILFGESGSVSEEMIIKLIEPLKDLTAKLTLIHYDEGILNADQGTIPPFDSNITFPPDVTKFVPEIPNINNIISDETVLITQNDGTLISRIVVNFNIQLSGRSTIPITLQAQYKIESANNEAWMDIPSIPANSGILSIPNVKDGIQYIIRIRFISSYGVPSDWVEVVHTVAGKNAAPPPITNFSASFIDNQVELLWSKSTVADIRNYRLSYGSFAGENDLGFSDTTTFRIPAQWEGIRTFWIVPYDTSENTGDAVSTSIEVVLPVIASVTTEIIDNNVIIKWTNTQGSLPVISNEARKGDDYDNPDKIIGDKTGSFTSFFEASKGLYTYWVTAQDSAGNVSTPVSIQAQVNEPPDFVAYTNIFKGFADGDLYTNCFSDNTERLIIPVNATETWTEHFVNNSFTSFQDFIDGGYDAYAEPALLTGEYNEEFDIGTVIPTANIESVVDRETIGLGTITFETYIEYKKLIGDSWITNGNTTTINASDFQYIRMRYVVTSSDDKTLAVLNKQTINVSAKEKRDGGNGSYTPGFALQNDSTNDYYATAANSASLNITGSVSIAAWVKLPPLISTGLANIVFKTFYGLQYNGTTKQIIGGGSQGNTTYDIPDVWRNHWIHIIDVITASTHELYINGIGVDSQSGYSPTSGTNLFYILGDGGTGGIDAFINDLRVYAGEITAEEADSIYRDKAFVPVATIAAQWDFTEGTGTSVADTSGNSNTVTLSSANMWADDQGEIVFFNKTFIDIKSISPTLEDDETGNGTIFYDFLDIPYAEYFHALPYNGNTGDRKAVNFSWNCIGI